jgi:hypothetical protein
MLELTKDVFQGATVMSLAQKSRLGKWDTFCHAESMEKKTTIVRKTWKNQRYEIGCLKLGDLP